MPARTAACHRRCRRTGSSAWSAWRHRACSPSTKCRRFEVPTILATSSAGTSNRKAAPVNINISRAPLIPKFARECAAQLCELWDRSTRDEAAAPTTASSGLPHHIAGGEFVTDGLLLFGSLDRILDLVKFGEFHVVQFAIQLRNLAHVDVLDDVARIRIDLDRSARTLPFHALHGVDQSVTIGRAIGLLERIIDQVHAVIATDRHEVGTEMIGFLEGF